MNWGHGCYAKSHCENVEFRLGVRILDAWPVVHIGIQPPALGWLLSGYKYVKYTYLLELDMRRNEAIGLLQVGNMLFWRLGREEVV